MSVFQEWLCFGLERQKEELEEYFSGLEGDRREIVPTGSRSNPTETGYRESLAMWKGSFFTPIWRWFWSLSGPNTASLLGIQTHSHADHLPDNFDFARIMEVTTGASEAGSEIRLICPP